MTRLEKLKAKLRSREGKAGYEKNCEAIKAEIARLEGSPVPEIKIDDQPTTPATNADIAKRLTGTADAIRGKDFDL